MGGVGKGTLIREVDAMDGLCGRISGTFAYYLRLPMAHPGLIPCRQGWDPVSNIESLKGRRRLGMQRVLGQLSTRLIIT